MISFRCIPANFYFVAILTWTVKVKDKHISVGLSGCRTIGLSDQRDVGLTDYSYTPISRQLYTENKYRLHIYTEYSEHDINLIEIHSVVSEEVRIWKMLP
jgi:hypothetical protein